MKQYVRRHMIFLISLTTVLIGGSVVIILLFVGAHSREVARTTSLATYTKKMDDTIAKLKLQKQQKDTATKLAKQKADEAAKKAADEKTTQPTTPISAPGPVANTSSTHADPASIDVVVNKKHPLNPLSYVPNIQSVSCAGNGTAQLQVQVVADFTALCQAAAAAGQPLGVSSSYRSYNTQVSTYNYWVSTSGQAGADTYSARPGYSEHQTGFAADLRVPNGPELSDFTGTSQQQWLAANAYKYGFIQRYTDANGGETGYTAESWHFRYVGRAVAASYTSSGASSLESYWGISGGGY